jgi:hypothetical protein
VSRLTRVEHKFVELLPDELKPGMLYISVDFATCEHLCFCGCGSKVVTPLSPADWKLTYDGETVSLSPSVGNWSFDCRSHYVIRANQVRWARRFSRAEVDGVRARDVARTRRHFGEAPNEAATTADGAGARERSWIGRVRAWVKR